MVPTNVHPEFTKGDLELVASDGVSFRVDRARLSAAR